MSKYPGDISALGAQTGWMSMSESFISQNSEYQPAAAEPGSGAPGVPLTEEPDVLPDGGVAQNGSSRVDSDRGVAPAPVDKSFDEDRAVREIVERLQERFPAATQDAVAAAVERARNSFDDAKVRDFVPVLIEKEAKKILKGKRG